MQLRVVRTMKERLEFLEVAIGHLELRLQRSDAGLCLLESLLDRGDVGRSPASTLGMKSALLAGGGQLGLEQPVPLTLTVQLRGLGGRRRSRDDDRPSLGGVQLRLEGVLAAANRTSVVLKALGEAMHQLAATLPTVVTACGAIVAALSQPPDLQKRVK